jgi:hypothetical protein
MSSGLDNVSDDADQDASGDQDRLRGIRPSTEEDMGSPPESDGVEGRRWQSSNEGLNPWSIAKLVSTNRRTSPPPERIVRELRRQEDEVQVLQQGVIESDLMPVTQELPPRSRHAPQLGGYERLEDPATEHEGLRAASRDALRSLPILSTWERKRRARPRRQHGLQSPPTSSPHEYALSGCGSKQRYQPQQAAVPGRLVQSQISFGVKSGRQQQKHSHRTGTVASRQTALSPPPGRRRRAPTAASRLDVVEASLMVPGFVSASRVREEVPSHTQPLFRQPLHRTNSSSEHPANTHLREEPGEEPARPTIPTDDPRAHLIKERQHMMEHPQRKPRRLKTEQLPLETIPRGLQTCTLLLTVTATRGDLAQLFPSASQFDTWLLNGKLRDAIQGETGPDDTAILVNSLLSRIDYGVGASG